MIKKKKCSHKALDLLLAALLKHSASAFPNDRCGSFNRHKYYGREGGKSACTCRVRGSIYLNGVCSFRNGSKRAVSYLLWYKIDLNNDKCGLKK